MTKNIFSYEAHMNSESTENEIAKPVLELEFRNLINEMFDNFPSAYRAKSPEKWAERLIGGKYALTIEIVKKAIDEIVENDNLPQSYSQFRDACARYAPTITDGGDGAKNERRIKKTIEKQIKLYKVQVEAFEKKYGKDALNKCNKEYYQAVWGKGKNIYLDNFKRLFLQDLTTAIKRFGKEERTLEELTEIAILIGKEVKNGSKEPEEGT